MFPNFADFFPRQSAIESADDFPASFLDRDRAKDVGGYVDVMTGMGATEAKQQFLANIEAFRD